MPVVVAVVAVVVTLVVEVGVVVDVVVDVAVVDVVVVAAAVVVLVVVVFAVPQEDNKIAVTIRQLNANHAIFLRISSLLFLFLYIYIGNFYQYIPYVLFCQSAFITSD